MSHLNNVLPVGSRIETKIGNIDAIVIGICIRGLKNESVEYQVSYFLNGENKTPWLHSYEIDLKIDNSKQAGFSITNNQTLLNQ
ncbi:hypothetical protein PL373_06055 [Tenacibaculum maritimum]|nr:hypothetical protein [Tenacibaculum maritimum]MDB0600714.1 hypothetical protein [Tenacibaculum maritimum]MDB0612697.1 hypothetical protein [Tenacibaculum maritimum]